MPLYAYGLYWYSTPQPLQRHMHGLNFLVILVLLVVLPVLIYPILRKANKVRSVHLETLNERLWPLGINAILWLSFLVYLQLVVPRYSQTLFEVSPGLISFFFGGALCILMALIMVILKHKSSLHMMGVSGLITHLLLQSAYFGQSSSLSIVTISTFGLLAIIWVGVTRFKEKAHSRVELLSGFCVGVCAQILALVLTLNT
jgi:hypothetical protein